MAFSREDSVVNETPDRSESSFSTPPTLASAVVDYLKDAILAGAYPPGSALREIPLSQAVSASRTTVREALRVLSDIGLVVIHPRRGASVASMSPKLVREIFSLRAVLEPFAIKLALTEGRIRTAELDRIEQAFENLRHTAKDGDAFATIEADMGFHWAFCAPCGHELLLEQLRSLQTRTRQFIFYTHFYESDSDGEVESHMPILMAIRSLEPDRAEAAVHKHIVSVGERLLIRMLDEAKNN